MEVFVNNLSYAYKNTDVLKNITFKIPSGAFLAVLGHNGSGKSTLMKCLLGINKVSNDKIYLDGIDINNFKNNELVGYVSQDFNSFNFEFPITVKEILLSTQRKKIDDELLLSELKKVGLEAFLNKNINKLSGGQLQRVFIARALINKPRLLILDEPTVGIDRENIKVLYDTLEKLNKDGMTIIIVTHDTSHLNRIASHVLSLQNTILFFGEMNKYNFKLCEDC